MKKIVAILLTLAIMLVFTVPAMAYVPPLSQLRIVDIHNYIQRNIFYLDAVQKAQLQALRAQFSNWANLTQAEKTQLLADMQALMTAIKGQVAEKKAAYAEFIVQINPLIGQIRANNTELSSLFRQNQKLRGEIRAQLEYLKTLPDPAIPPQVTTDLATLKTLYQTLKDTKGDIADILKANRDNIRNMDYGAVTLAFEGIISIQETRIETMTQINELLTEIHSLLPEVPASTATPAPTATP